MRSICTLILCSYFLAACEQGSKAEPKNAPVAVGSVVSNSILNDAAHSYYPVEQGKALSLSSMFTGASANGQQADLHLRFRVNADVQKAVTPASQVVVSINENGRAQEIHRQRVNTQTMEGELDITFEPTTAGSSLVVGLQGLDTNSVVNVPTYSTIALPKVTDQKDSDLNNIAGIDVQLVPGSYNTKLIGDRRQHQFAVRVLAHYNNQPVVSSECLDIASMTDGSLDLKPVIGLDANADDNFIALEYGSEDNESPMSVSFNKASLGVYFVMDGSSSVFENGVAQHMLDAVSRTVISLGRIADFDYRLFGTDVFELNSLRDITLDDPAGSGTALYYAIDTALEDIESYAPASQNKLIIAISDGQDLASRNYYPDFGSHTEVRQYITQRLSSVRDDQNSLYDSQLSAYFIELPGQHDSGEMQAVAASAGGFHFQIGDKHGLRDSLQTVTDYVGGSYDLVYSSQQTPDDTLLELKVHAGNCSATIQLPTQHGS